MKYCGAFIFDIFGEVSYKNRIINAVRLLEATGVGLTVKKKHIYWQMCLEQIKSLFKKLLTETTD